jgi:uncharacterized Zn finger protein (UPF0148 family)
MNTEGTRFEFIDKELTEMHTKGYIKVGEHQQRWVLDKKGREMLTRLVGMFDQFLRFEIFSDVIIDQELPDDITDEEGGVLDHCFDPRFSQEGCKFTSLLGKAEDMRIAMMEYFVESCKREGKPLELDPHRIIFLQMLADGKFAESAADFWFNLRLGEIFKTIEEVVKTNYHWRDLGNDDEESWEVAKNVYAAGMLEQRKREGETCSACGIPLAIFEADAQANNEELLDCPDPDCAADFRPEAGAPDAEYECPQCKADVHSGQTVCTKCGAHIDFSLPEGAVVEETVEETTTETVDDYYDDGFGCYYGYTPCGWYDPWYPCANAMAFGLVCGAMIY